MEEEQTFCYKHKNEPTALRCGKCDRYICHKCLSLSPAGTRCHECARNNVGLQPKTILADLKIGAKRLTRMNPWHLYIFIIIAFLIVGQIRSCSMQNNPQPSSSQVDSSLE